MVTDLRQSYLPRNPVSDEGGPRRIRRGKQRRSLQGALIIELLVAMALLTGVLIPVAYSFASERRLARASYQRAVAMEIVDGEMEALLATKSREYKPGSYDYTVKAGAATNLGPGKFVLEVENDKLRLTWHPQFKHQGGEVRREGTRQ